MIEASQQFSLPEILKGLEKNEYFLIAPFLKGIKKDKAVLLFKDAVHNHNLGCSTGIGAINLSQAQDNTTEALENPYEFTNGQAQFITLALLKKCYMDILCVNQTSNPSKYTTEYESIMNQLGRYSMSGYRPLIHSKDKTEDAEICAIFNWKPNCKEDLCANIQIFATNLGIFDTSVMLENYHELLQVILELLDAEVFTLDNLGELIDSMTVTVSVNSGYVPIPGL